MSAYPLKAVRGRFVAIAAVAVVSALAVAGGSASAAGNGYGPTAPPSAAAAGFTTVVEAQNVGPAGGTLTGSYGGQSFALTIPRHALPATKEVVITQPDVTTLSVGRGLRAVAGIGVAFINPFTGQKYNGTLSPPVTLTIADPVIAGNDMIESITGPGQFSIYRWATVTKGRVLIVFDADPNFAVVASNGAGGHPPGPRRGPGRPHRWGSPHGH